MNQIPQLNQNNSNTNGFLASFFARHQKNLVLALLALAAFLILRQIFFQPATITVIGTGKVAAMPAKVEMTVTRVDSSIDPIVAVNQGEDNTKNLINESKGVLANPEIQRAFYQVTPTIVGGDKLYQVVNVFKLTSNEPAKTSELIKTLYNSGAITVSNVSFLPDQQSDVTQEARKAALKDARQQARNIARAAGKRVGRILLFNDDLLEASGTVVSEQDQQNPEVSATDFLISAPEKIEIKKAVSVTYTIW